MDTLYPLPVKSFNPNYSFEMRDRNGELLRAYLTDDEMWWFKTEDQQITPTLISTVIEYEDQWFYYHPGINPFAIIRAVYTNILSGRVVSGASTITMQVARMMEPKDRTVKNKLFEMFRTLQIEWKYTKDEILLLYFDRAPYGGNIVGLSTASRFYYGKYPSQLTLGESAALAAIPQNPNLMRPDSPKSQLRNGQKKILKRLLADDKITMSDYTAAQSETLPTKRVKLPFIAPHLGDMLKKKHRSGQLTTTVDLKIQQKTEWMMKESIRGLNWQGIYNSCALVVNPVNNDILAFVGSNDWFDNAHNGQVNGVLAKRSPGSTIKPFAYGLGMELGKITPKSYFKDIPVNYLGYSPENYDGEFQGLVSAEQALSTSLNVPAINLVAKIGLEEFYSFLKEAGVSSLSKPPEHYGLPLVLGGGDIQLYELVNLYSGLANSGIFRPLNLVMDKTVKTGNALLSPGTTWILGDILANGHRPDLPAVWESVKDLPKIAWKTGTSYGHKDAWAIGYSPQLVIGIWVGNFNAKPVVEMNGANITTPILFKVFKQLSDPKEKYWFTPPSSIGTRMVCSISGKLPNKSCDNIVQDNFIKGVSSIKKCDLHTKVFVDKRRSYEYCNYCDSGIETVEELSVNFPADVQHWYASIGMRGDHLSHNPKCKLFSDNTHPEILSPISSMNYILSPYQTLESQKIPFKSVVSTDIDSMYWFLGKSMIKKSARNEVFFWLPEKGNHTLSCLDDKGRYSSVRFVID